MHKHASSIFAPLFTVLSALALAQPASADTIAMMWDPSPSSEVAGYVVHVGTQPGTYTQHVDVGLTTTWSHTSAVAGQRYCFAVSAYYDGPIEGPRSNEVCGFSNASPELVNPGAQGSTVGQADTLQFAGSDLYSDPLTYSATGLPPGLTLMASTGYVSGTPTTVGTYSVTARASDGVLTASQTFTWTVTASSATLPANTAPTLANVGNQSSVAGLATTLQLAGSDPDGGVLTYSATGLPPGLSVGASSGLISGTPNLVGAYNVTVSVSDGALSASRTFTWTVASGSSAGTMQLAWDAVPDSRVIGYKVYVGTQPGTYTQTFDAGLATTWTFSIPVAGQQYCFAVSAYIAGNVEGPKSSEVCGYGNEPPTLASIADQTGNVGQSATLQLVGSDPEGRTLTYSATGLPSGLSAAPATGLISGAPTTGGVFNVTASVSDGVFSASRTFTWTIVAADTTRPVVTITSPTSSATFFTSTGTITLSGAASDNVGVTKVSWLNSRGGSGQATGTTTWTETGIALQSGENVLTVTAKDAAGNTAKAILTVTFNAAPTLESVAHQTSVEAEPASLQLNGADADGDTLTYEANGLPPGLSLGASTGRILGTPTTPGSYPVTVRVSDGTQTATRTFTWTVDAETVAPVVTITGPTTSATFFTSTGTITLSGTASDNVGVTKVSWLNSRGGTGQATGTTSWTETGIALQSGENVFTITAKDAAGNTAKAILTVTFNAAPTLASVANQTSLQSEPASLQLNGVDADGDTLTYNANGLPPGLALNASTGLISGTPTAPGSYPVTVKVSDGVQGATDTFTWTISPNPLRVASLTANRPAPQPLGTTVRFTAVGAGGTGPYEYRWLVYDGTKWVTKAKWSSNSQFVWTPTFVSAYKVRAVVRDTSTSAMATMDFPIVQ
jgi:hypothetical protein